MFPVLNDGLPDETKTAHQSHLLHQIFKRGKAALDLRGHVLDDAVDKVKALVVVGLGGDKLLENSEQTRLRGKSKHLNTRKSKKKTTTLKPVLAYYFIRSGA